MHKQMKLITTAGILGLFLVGNYAFEFLSKIGAGILSAVLTEQLTAEAWNGELFAAIGQQSVPFLLMMVMGAVLIQWSKSKGKALEAEDAGWAESAFQRKVTGLAIVGGLLGFAGFYNLFLPIYFGYQDLIMAFSSPEGVDYVLKAVLPNYVILLVQIALGIWMVLGKKEQLPQVAAAPAGLEQTAPAENEEQEGIPAVAPVLETGDVVPVTEAATEAEEKAL